MTQILGQPCEFQALGDGPALYDPGAVDDCALTGFGAQLVGSEARKPTNTNTCFYSSPTWSNAACGSPLKLLAVQLEEGGAARRRASGAEGSGFETQLAFSCTRLYFLSFVPFWCAPCTPSSTRSGPLPWAPTPFSDPPHPPLPHTYLPCPISPPLERPLGLLHPSFSKNPILFFLPCDFWQICPSPAPLARNWLFSGPWRPGPLSQSH